MTNAWVACGTHEALCLRLYVQAAIVQLQMLPRNITIPTGIFPAKIISPEDLNYVSFVAGYLA